MFSLIMCKYSVSWRQTWQQQSFSMFQLFCNIGIVYEVMIFHKNVTPQKSHLFVIFLMTKYVELGTKLIIRPPRSTYDINSLPKKVGIPGYGTIERIPVNFKNKRNFNIVGSFYKPNEDIFELPCVIYLHGNASNQKEGTFLPPIFIPAGVSVLCFDFSGCGNSDGEYISLGYYEKDDVTCAIDFIRSNFGVGRVALWGRSMGAITSIYALADDPTIAAAVLDSPLASLPDLAKELAEREKISGFIVSSAQWLIGRKIKELAGFDIAKVVPVEVAPMCFSPALFIHGEQDDFINKSHTERLFKVYAGEDKQVMYVPGNHNSKRPFDTMIAAVLFIARNLDAPVVIDDAARAIGGHAEANHFADLDSMMYAMDDDYIPPEAFED